MRHFFCLMCDLALGTRWVRYHAVRFSFSFFALSLTCWMTMGQVNPQINARDIEVLQRHQQAMSETIRTLDKTVYMEIQNRQTLAEYVKALDVRMDKQEAEIAKRFELETKYHADMLQVEQWSQIPVWVVLAILLILVALLAPEKLPILIQTFKKTAPFVVIGLLKTKRFFVG